MTTFAARLPAAFARLNRRRDERLVAGVCAGLAGSARVDPTFVRLVFAFLALAGGAGIVAYFGAWLALPEEEGEPLSRRRRFLGVGFVLVAFGLALRSVGLADSVLWPAVLVAAGVFVFQSRDDVGARGSTKRRVVAAWH